MWSKCRPNNLGFTTTKECTTIFASIRQTTKRNGFKNWCEDVLTVVIESPYQNKSENQWVIKQEATYPVLWSTWLDCLFDDGSVSWWYCSAVTDDDARMDIRASGFWRYLHHHTYFNDRVVNSFAASNWSATLAALSVDMRLRSVVLTRNECMK